MRLNVPMLMQQYQADTLGADGNELDELVARELEQLYDLILFLDAVHSWEELMNSPEPMRITPRLPIR